ncbi:hypothetical protein [Pseudonocardia acidicola]|uniref:Uncharacterized protein n=1 Tax=Pseudonocardia acidicola TaxID=2724939 RepID=A0ABX1SJQ5_9PSEU|nr:hypothetical protein [Pseudonocardia acidicola]NMI00379.1 hypothetical protein [Pseudonocardia acidicola]
MHALGSTRIVALAALLGAALVLAVAGAAAEGPGRRGAAPSRHVGEPALHHPTPTPRTALSTVARPYSMIRAAVPATTAVAAGEPDRPLKG